MLHTLYVPSYANNKPLRYYDNRNRIMTSFSNVKMLKKLMNKPNPFINKTMTRVMIDKKTIDQDYHGYDTYDCHIWIYPARDLTMIQPMNMKDVLDYGDSFTVIQEENDQNYYSAKLFIPNGPIIDVDYAIEI